MNDDSFYQAIIDEPGDIDARLVYGDWLAEHGDPRGEFIQCEVAASRTPSWSAEHADLHYRARLLLQLHRKEWSCELDAVIKKFAQEREQPSRVHTTLGMAPRIMYPVSYKYRIGFADQFVFANMPFRKLYEALAKVTPIRQLIFPTFTDKDAESANPVLLKKIKQLDLNLSSNSRSLKVLLGKKSPLRLQQLRLYLPKGRISYDPSSPRSARELNSLVNLLVKSDCLEHLTDFSINAQGFGKRYIQKLVDSPAFKNLQRLTLVEGSFGDDGLEVIAKSNLPKQLEHLKVKLTAIGDSGFKRLAESNLENLKTLSMGWWYGSNPTIAGFAALANSPSLRGLYHLDLKGWSVPDDCFGCLCNSENFSGIRMLNLANTGLDDKKLELLANSDYLRLRYLDLESNPKMTRHGFKMIVNSPVVEDLTWLNLRECGWGDEAVKMLARSKYIRQLRFLSLERSKLTNGGLEKLAESEYFVHLRELNLRENDQLRNEGIVRLLDSVVVSQLQIIDLTRCNLQESAVANRLKERFGSGLKLTE